jgi:hypothetical protein
MFEAYVARHPDEERHDDERGGDGDVSKHPPGKVAPFERSLAAPLVAKQSRPVRGDDAHGVFGSAPFVTTARLSSQTPLRTTIAEPSARNADDGVRANTAANSGP